MPKAYWVARVTIHDEAAYDAYRKANGPAFAKYGARFVVRAGRFERKEGSSRERNVVIEFPSYEAALACYDSPEYAAARAFRLPVADCDLVIVEGYDGPQPG